MIIFKIKFIRRKKRQFDYEIFEENPGVETLEIYFKKHILTLVINWVINSLSNRFKQLKFFN